MLADISYVNSFKIPITYSTAAIYLENLSQRVNIFNLYQKIFPEKWLESTIPVSQHTHRESVYLDREIEFIKAVDEHLFPIEYIDDIEFIDEYTDIPISAQKSDWWLEDFEDLEYAEKFFISLIGQGCNINEWKLYFGFTPEFIAPAKDIHLRKLARLCRRYKSPIRHLVTAIEIIDYSTENIWLDISCETSDSLEWNYENVMFLTQKWQEALLMLEKSNALASLIETSLAARKIIVKLWNQASET